MSIVSLSLLVIRVADVDRAVHFYEQLGLHFEKQQHGKGPVHYSTDLGITVFEIYPYKEGSKATEGVRLGFIVESLSEVIERLKALDMKISSSLQRSEFGQFAVVEDFDGHKVELTEIARCAPADARC